MLIMLINICVLTFKINKLLEPRAKNQEPRKNHKSKEGIYVVLTPLGLQQLHRAKPCVLKK